MEFLNPGMLALAGAAAAPVILHLIMRQAPKHIIFPALQFIRQRQESNRRRLRLRHLLLLLLRAMALALLAFALARPSVTASGLSVSQEAPVSAVLVIDTSPTMSYLEENKTRLEHAQEIAKWLLAEIPSESQIAVIDSRIDSNVFQVDINAAVEFLNDLQLTNIPARFDSAIESAWDLVKKGDHDAKEIYVFTDLTRGGWPSESATRLAEMASENPGVSVNVVDVGVLNPQNTRLAALHLSKQNISQSQTLTLRGEVERIGQVNQANVQLWLQDDDGELVMRDQKSVSFSSSGGAEVEFLLSNLPAGTHQGEVRLSSRDKLAIDDRRYFTVDSKPKWPVLMASPSLSREYDAEYNVSYLADALTLRFDGTTLDQNELGKANYSDYSVIALVDPRPLSADEWNGLREYVEEGGALAIFLGRNAGGGDRFNIPAAQALLPGELSQVATWSQRDVHIDEFDYRHSMLSRFQEWDAPWRDSWIYRAWQFKNTYEGVQTIVQFTNGTPALLERVIGEGRVLVMTTPISDDLRRDDDPNYEGWTNLPIADPRWPFVALMNELFLDLAVKTDETLNFPAGPGMTAVLHIDPDAGIARYKLRNPPTERYPAGEEMFRDTNPVDARILVSSIEEIGNYRVELRPKGLDRGFSVNLSSEQTDLERIDISSLNAFFAGREIPVARTQDELQRNVTFTHFGQEMFPWIILIVALIMGVEHVLANRFYGMRDAPTDQKDNRSVLAGFRTSPETRNAQENSLGETPADSRDFGNGSPAAPGNPTPAAPA
ncbi:MAG: BatA and WFA domain-containing protein [Pirellulales bacterium]|nr:BatA and WFA domain-containing protein [Pirellulales bacterium]